MSGALDIEKRGWTICNKSATTDDFPQMMASYIGRRETSSPPSKQPSSKLMEASDGRTILDQKIADAIAKRDEFWLKREKAQLDFVRKETEKLMDKMHNEMERMHMTNRELERRLYVEKPQLKMESDEPERLRRDISEERKTNADLKRELGLAVKRSARLAQTLEKSAHMQKEQAEKYEQKLSDLQEQVRRLNGLLLTKSKSRSIGPTVVRFGSDGSASTVRRTQSGNDESRQSAGAGSSVPWPILAGDYSLPQAELNGIDVKPTKWRRQNQRRPIPTGPFRLAMTNQPESRGKEEDPNQ